MAHNLKNVLLNKTYWSAAVLVVFVILVLSYVSSNWAEFARLELSHPEFIGMAAAMSFINLFGTGRSMDAVLRPLGLRLGRFETFGLAAITRLGNQVAPGKLGLAVRAAYLKNRYKLPLTQFTSSLAATQILTYFISSMLGLVAIMWIWQEPSTPQLAPFALLLAGIMLGLFGLLFFSPHIKKRRIKFLNHFVEAINGWHTIRHDRSALLYASVWVLVNILSQTLVVFAVFNSFNADIPLTYALFITSINIFSALIGITPAGIGITEGLIVGAASAVGVPASLALSAALLRRAIIFTVVCISTLLSSHKLFGQSVFRVIKQQKAG